jgi:predicted branched-subunit amino acid permease
VSSVKHRVSNVLARAGFPFLPSLFICLVMSLLTQDKDYNLAAAIAIVYGLLIWLPSGIVNYIMVGSFRVLPWKQIGEGAE